MREVLDLLVALDHDAIRATGDLRWGPATAALVLVSAWWVKGPFVVAVGCCADLANRRRYPLVALAATIGFFVASGANALLKAAVDRSRPPQEMGVEAVIGVPASSSFPSGHAMTAWATAGAIAVLAPRLRWPVLALATAIAFSRVYLGVHFWLDVLAGAALGLAIGVLAALALRLPLRRETASPAAIARRCRERRSPARERVGRRASRSP
jgi:membrane-associated phospholipid phosphatase